MEPKGVQDIADLLAQANAKKKAEAEKEESAQKAAMLLIGLVTLIVEPFIIVALWRWFVEGFGLPALHWGTAFGFNVIMNIWVGQLNVGFPTKERLDRAAATLTRALTAFAIGWIVYKLTN